MHPLKFWGCFFAVALIFNIVPPLGGVLALAWVGWFVFSLVYEPKAVRDRRAAHRAKERAVQEYREERRSERAAQIARGEIPPDFADYADYMASDWWRSLRDHTLDYLGRACEFCHGAAAQVHHVRYPRRFGYESVKSLFAVCERCHDVAHGDSPSHAECAFCGERATRTLDLTLSHTERASHRTCRRCWHLASGYRGQAHGWSREHYAAWVQRWRDTLSSRAKRTGSV